MSALPAPVVRLIESLTKLPGVGEKTATRFAFHLLRTTRQEVEELSESLVQMRQQTVFCSVCQALTAANPCPLCTDPARQQDMICVIERPADLIALERSGQFKGRYHVLHGSLSPLDGIGPEQLRITELLSRLEDGSVREVVLATNPTAEGEATAIYLSRLIKPLEIRVTRIAHGLPMGADVEYADGQTLGHALDGRREM